MSSHLVPGDEAFHDDKKLMADLTALNGQLTRYIVRHLDADAERAAPATPDNDRALGRHLMQLGMDLLGRAERRAASDTPPALEGDATLRRLTNGRPSER